MTKRSAIAVAMGLVASILAAAVALSMNFQIGTPASATDEPVKIEKKAPTDKGPIVKRRTVTIHRDKPARIIGGGTVTIPAGSGGGGVSTRSTSGGSFSSHDDDGSEDESEDREDHEGEDHEGEDHEGEDHEGGDD